MALLKKVLLRGLNDPRSNDRIRPVKTDGDRAFVRRHEHSLLKHADHRLQPLAFGVRAPEACDNHIFHLAERTAHLVPLRHELSLSHNFEQVGTTHHGFRREARR